MAVPEATVNEDGEILSWENNIWRAGETSIVKSVSKSAGVQGTPNDHFRVRILLPHGRH